MKSNYKIAIKQNDKLFFLAHSDVVNGYFLTIMERYATWFPTCAEGVEALRTYCHRTFKGEFNKVPMVIIKLKDCPLILAEKKNEEDFNEFNFFN